MAGRAGADSIDLAPTFAKFTYLPGRLACNKYFFEFCIAMKKLQANHTGKGQLFNAGWLEVLTRTSVPLTIVFYGAIWLAFLSLNYFNTNLSFFDSAIFYILALFGWTLFEYLMHRYVFHFINERPWTHRFHYLIHGVHHEYPRDEERLFMPPLPGLLIICVLTGLFSFMGNHTWIWMAGFLNGWAIYVGIHYIVHTYQPRRPFKILWTHHAKHHYKQGNKAFGVSTPFWDLVFGTMPD